MIHSALYEPEIPSNTGNIIRLCANIGAKLHLIEPLGFNLDDKNLRRAGLDYHEFTVVKCYSNFEMFFLANPNKKIWACTTKADKYYHQVRFDKDNILLFGSESRGFPKDIRNYLEETKIKLPMHCSSRSLNLSNAASVILFEALRQLNFVGLL